MILVDILQYRIGQYYYTRMKNKRGGYKGEKWKRGKSRLEKWGSEKWQMGMTVCKREECGKKGAQ
jgi:hypothetical protein